MAEMDEGHAALPLSIAGLAKSYGKVPILKGLDLAVPAGVIHGLAGLNGSGKTTMMACALGLLSYEGGDIRVFGRSPRHIASCRGRVVAIFDRPALPPQLTVRQCLRHARLLCPQPRRTAAEAERLLGIERYSDYKIHQLSLGNQRRAAIAHGLLGSPELIMLDEPFNGLDAGGVDEVLDLIARLRREDNMSFLLSSHQLPYLERVCSHLSILHDGRVARGGTLGDLLRGQGERVLLRSERLAEARAQLRQLDGACLLEADGETGEEAAGDTLTVELSGLTAAELNARLVTAGIPVSELSPRRASVESLFRAVTGASS